MATHTVDSTLWEKEGPRRVARWLKIEITAYFEAVNSVFLLWQDNITKRNLEGVTSATQTR